MDEMKQQCHSYVGSQESWHKIFFKDRAVSSDWKYASCLWNRRIKTPPHCVVPCVNRCIVTKHLIIIIYCFVDWPKFSCLTCYRSCAHGQGLLCFQLRADEFLGSIQWKMTLLPRLCVKTADNCDKSYPTPTMKGRQTDCDYTYLKSF